jgi:hypothetical protein
LAKLLPLVPAVLGSTGNCRLLPGVRIGGAMSLMLVVEAEPAPIQPWIHTSSVAEHADGSATQQL